MGKNILALMAVAAADKAPAAPESAPTPTVPEAVAPPTVPDEAPTAPTPLTWSSSPSKYPAHEKHIGASADSEFSITPVGKIDVFTHYLVQVKPLAADWSDGVVIGRFQRLDAAKEAAARYAEGRSPAAQ